MPLDMKSDIGNQFGVISSYADASGLPLSFLDARWTSLAEWQAQARAKLLELLRYEPAEAPLNPVVTASRRRGPCLEEDITFNTSLGVRVQGTVLSPGTGGPHPAVIALHDHGGFYYYGREKVMETDREPEVLAGFKQAHYGGRSWANDLAALGFVVLCIDSFYFGTRRLDPALVSEAIRKRCPVDPLAHAPGSDAGIEAVNSFCGWMENLMVRHIHCTGATWPGMLFYDDRKSVDYLLTRPDVDAGRIGCCGLSIGGYRAVHLAALDTRIRCAVAAGWMTTMGSLLFDHLHDHTHMVYIPGLYRYMDLPDAAGLAAPRSLFVQQCGQDMLFTTEGMADACRKLERIYEKASCPDRFRYSFYPNGHAFTTAMQKDAFDFLRHGL